MYFAQKNEADTLPTTTGVFVIPGKDSPDGKKYALAPRTNWSAIDGIPAELNSWNATEYPLVATSGWKVDSGSCVLFEKGNMRILRIAAQLTPTEDATGIIPCCVKPAIAGLADWQYFPMMISGNYTITFSFHDGQGVAMLGDRVVKANEGHLQLNSTIIL